MHITHHFEHLFEPELHLYSGQSAAASQADQVVQYLEQQNHIQGV